MTNSRCREIVVADRYRGQPTSLGRMWMLPSGADGVRSVLYLDITDVDGALQAVRSVLTTVGRAPEATAVAGY